MDDQSLKNVLGVLRLLKAGQLGHSTLSQLQNWVGGTGSEVQILKVASYVIEQASLAKTVIVNSQLSVEAKDGVVGTIDGVVVPRQHPWHRFDVVI